MEKIMNRIEKIDTKKSFEWNFMRIVTENIYFSKN
jgi:hypothetical protein